MEDIPLLNDIVTGRKDVTNNSSELKPAQDPETTPSTSPSSTKNGAKENPFLPYEHLARLALEREQFTQSLEAFTDNLKHKQPYSERTHNARHSTSTNNNDVIVSTITNNIIKQLRPIIEEKVTSELELYFEDTKDGA